jgi:Sulfotransferase family
MLRRQPHIHMPAKEPRYFTLSRTDLDADEPIQSRSAGAHDKPGTRPHTLEAYRALFADARPEQRIGEATPAYLRSTVAAARIAAAQPRAKIIAILREPASFLRSYHLQSLRTYNETQKDFRKAMELEDARREGRSIPRSSTRPEDLQYSNHVRYVEQLRRYHDVFARERVLVLIYDDFRADNEATVRQVLRFLDLDDAVPVHTVETKPSREIRFTQLHQLVRMRRAAKRDRATVAALSRTVNALTPSRLQGSVKGTWRRVAYSEPFKPDESFMLELRRRFKPEVVALSEYLDRDLVTLWGYDKLA